MPVNMNKMIKRLLLLLLVLLLPVSCSLPGAYTSPPPIPAVSAMQPVLVLAPLDATPTSTPFQPLPPTPTYIPTAFPTSTPQPTPTPEPTQFVSKTWAEYPGPMIWPDIDIPPPVPRFQQPEGQVNILLLGSDQRTYTPGFRTDTIVLLTLNPADGTASLTSFPRDLYVYIPGYTVQRINTAFPRGGFEMLSLTFEYNFGVVPDHFALITFWAFEQGIDSLGGLTVQVARSLSDHRDGMGTYTVPAGQVRMDGQTALWYVRSRYTSSDFDRGRRQQEVLRAGFEKLLSIDGIARAPQLFDIYRKSVTTDLTFEDLASLLPLAARLTDTSRINQYSIGPQQVVNWRNTSGAAVLLPLRGPILEVMRQALNAP